MFDIASRGNEKDFIVCFNDSISLGYDGTILTKNGSHAGIDQRHVLAQIAKFLVYQWAAVVSLDANQLDLPVGKVHDLKCTGVIDKPTDIVGHDRLWINDDVNWHIVIAKDPAVPDIGGGSNPSNLGRRVEDGIGDLAGHHVDFVAVGDSNQHVSIFGTGLPEDIRM